MGDGYRASISNNAADGLSIFHGASIANPRPKAGGQRLLIDLGPLDRPGPFGPAISPNFRVTRPRRPPTKATSVLLPADSAGSSGFWGHYDCQLDANGVPSETEYVVGLEGVSFQKRQLALTFTTSILGKWTVSKNKGLVR